MATYAIKRRWKLTRYNPYFTRGKCVSVITMSDIFVELAGKDMPLNWT